MVKGASQSRLYYKEPPVLSPQSGHSVDFLTTVKAVDPAELVASPVKAGMRAGGIVLVLYEGGPAPALRHSQTYESPAAFNRLKVKEDVPFPAVEKRGLRPEALVIVPLPAEGGDHTNSSKAEFHTGTYPFTGGVEEINHRPLIELF